MRHGLVVVLTASLAAGCASPCERRLERVLGRSLPKGARLLQCDLDGPEQSPEFFRLKAEVRWASGGEKLADELGLQRTGLDSVQVLLLEALVRHEPAVVDASGVTVPGRAFAQKNGAILALVYGEEAGVVEIRARGNPGFAASDK